MLGGVAVWVRAASLREEGFRVGDLGAGVAAALVLYLVFFVGRPVLGQGVPGAAAQIASVYAVRAQAPWGVIVPLQVCVIAPGEELFWPGRRGSGGQGILGVAVSSHRTNCAGHRVPCRLGPAHVLHSPVQVTCLNPPCVGWKGRAVNAAKPRTVMAGQGSRPEWRSDD